MRGERGLVDTALTRASRRLRKRTQPPRRLPSPWTGRGIRMCQIQVLPMSPVVQRRRRKEEINQWLKWRTVLSDAPVTTVRSARGARQESSMFRRIPSQDVCKFLAGAFFVNAGILFYLYLARVSVPILGTGFIETPAVSGARSIVHTVLFVTFFYLGYIRKWKSH